MTGDVEDIVLLDVTPLSLGVETKGGVFTKLVDRNTAIPVRKTETFSTAEMNQTGVEVHVLQGERSMAHDNKSLGRFKLDGIPPMPAGMPQIEISYDINANGILNVTAKEKSTNKEASITIQNTTTLSEDEVDRMVKDAEANAERDREAREHTEAKNTLDSLRVQAQRTVDESAADDAAKQPVKDAIAEAQSAVDSDAPKSRLDELARDLSEKVAALQQAAPPARRLGRSATSS